LCIGTGDERNRDMATVVGEEKKTSGQSIQIFQRGRNIPANREFFVFNFEFNRIDCKVRVFPCTVIPCREYIFFAVYTVFVIDFPQRTAVRHT
jgi:hypothetical protein